MDKLLEIIGYIVKGISYVIKLILNINLAEIPLVLFGIGFSGVISYAVTTFTVHLALLFIEEVTKKKVIGEVTDKIEKYIIITLTVILSIISVAATVEN